MLTLKRLALPVLCFATLMTPAPLWAAEDTEAASHRLITGRQSQGDRSTRGANEPAYDARAGIGAPAGWSRSTHLFERSRVDVLSADDTGACARGGRYVFEVSGKIEKDVSTVMADLLKEYGPCTDDSGEELAPVQVRLNSAGGKQFHGYRLGTLFRRHGVMTVIESHAGCASSCALAFLGGTQRVIEDGGLIMFHAPYRAHQGNRGPAIPDCDVGRKALDTLKRYFVAMTDPATGDLLYTRTMSYCSARDGWVVSGGDEAARHGLTTRSSSP